MSVRLTGKRVAAIILFALTVGAFVGGTFALSYEWGLHSAFMTRVSEASKRGDGFATFDLTQEDGMPVFVNEIMLVHMNDLKLQEVQNLEQACRERDASPPRDLIPEGEYRGPQDVPWVVAVFQ